MKFLQHNCAGTYAVYDATLNVCLQEGIDIAVLQDPPRHFIKEVKPGVRFYPNDPNITRDAIIIVFNTSLRVGEVSILPCAVQIVLEKPKIVLASVYLRPGSGIESELTDLRNIAADPEVPQIWAGDFNARSTKYYDRVTNARGRIFTEWLTNNDLFILNENHGPTFQAARHGSHFQSCVDVTFANRALVNQIRNWTLQDFPTGSDHAVITFEYGGNYDGGISNVFPSTRFLVTKDVNWLMFARLMDDHRDTPCDYQQLDERGIDAEITNFTRRICDNLVLAGAFKRRKQQLHQSRSKGTSKGRKLPWFDEELENQQKVLKKARRRLAGCRRESKTAFYNWYNAQIKKFNDMVTHKRVNYWKTRFDQVTTGTAWEEYWKTIKRMQKPKMPDSIEIEGEKVSDPNQVTKIFYDFFYGEKERPAREWPSEQEEVQLLDHVAINKRDYLNVDYLKHTICTFGNRKAPGSDGLTAEMLKHLPRSYLERYLSILKRCDEIGYFPIAWKEAVSILIPKPSGKGLKAFRPIGLLSLAGKVFEKMIMEEIRSYLMEKRLLSERQYGFMPDKSCEQALLELKSVIQRIRNMGHIPIVFSFDIVGAFDNVDWEIIMQKLEKYGVPKNLRYLLRSYLNERKVKVCWKDGEHTGDLTRGCIQGSCLGPFLWNLLLNEILESFGDESQGIYIQAYADDVVIIFDYTVCGGVIIKKRVNDFNSWCLKNHLKISPEKSVMMKFFKRKWNGLEVKLNGTTIKEVTQMKLLGIIIDNKLLWNSHIEYLERKAESFHKALVRTIFVKHGPDSSILRLLHDAVLLPMITYCSNVWCEVIEVKSKVIKLRRLQGRYLRSCLRTYRTASYEDCVRLADVLPIDAEIVKRLEIHRIMRKPCLLMPNEDNRLQTERNLEHYKCVKGIVFPESDPVQSKFEIYTDGSCIDSKSGCAIVIKDVSRMRYLPPIKISLPEYSSIFQAELVAIREALTWVASEVTKSYQTPLEDPVVVTVKTDSMSSFMALKSYLNRNELVNEIKRGALYLRAKNVLINLQWVKAHVGNEGNELADSFAKEAALNLNGEVPEMKVPVSKSFIKLFVKRTRIERLNEGLMDDGRLIPRFGWNKIPYKISLSMELTRLLTNNGPFKEYLYKIRQVSSSVCQCGYANQNGKHLITTCEVFATERREVFSEIVVDLNWLQIERILKDEVKREAFSRFCEKIYKCVARWNRR